MLDVRDAESVRTVIARVAEERGRLDLLVNNAAGNFYAPSATLSPNAWRSVVEIDLFGTFYCSQAVAPVMRAPGWRADREHLNDPALPRLAADGARDGGQGGRGRADADVGGGVGAVGCAGERGGAGPDPDAGGAQGVRGAAGRARGAKPLLRRPGERRPVMRRPRRRCST